MGEEEFDDAIIFPITDIAQHDGEDDDYDDEDDDDDVTGRYAKQKNKSFKPLMSRRQMRRSKLGYGMQSQLAKLNLNDESPQTSSIDSLSLSASKTNWLKALKKIKKMEDPWAKFHIDDLPVEKCIRHRYNALKQKWVQDEVQVKVELEVSYLYHS